MKEATGELNTTVVVAIIVAVLAFFFFSVLWPRIRGNINYNSNCDQAICICEDKDEQGRCRISAGTKVTCHVKGDESKEIMCPWRG